MLTSLRRRSPRALEEGGFTLIEVMVALGILMVVSAGLVPLLVIGAKTSNLSALETVAKNLAQQRLEQMRNLPYYVAHRTGTSSTSSTSTTRTSPPRRLRFRLPGASGPTRTAPGPAARQPARTTR
ncbi:MAG: type IV pilus modification PilV family protein [Mycobacteriales bacterium]